MLLHAVTFIGAGFDRLSAESAAATAHAPRVDGASPVKTGILRAKATHTGDAGLCLFLI